MNNIINYEKNRVINIGKRKKDRVIREKNKNKS